MVRQAPRAIRVDCVCSWVTRPLHLLAMPPLVGCRYGIRGVLHLQDKEGQVARPGDRGAGVIFDKGQPLAALPNSMAMIYVTSLITCWG